MLKTLDVLIGFTLVMLIMSMAVTLLTQAITSLLNLRGVALKKGIASLLRLLDRTIDLNNAKQISDALLRDPLIGGAGIGEKRRLATAVHREELTKLLLEFAATETKVNPQPAPGNRPPANQPAAPSAANQPNVALDVFAAVRGSLAGNGVTNPNQLLVDIRKTALELEKSNPQMANNERANAAILHHAGETDFVAKLNAWFDQTMDRVSERFTMHSRIWTLVAAIGIAGVLQLDAVTIINRLSVDDNLRKDLVTMAIKNYSEPQATAKAAAPAGAAGGAAANTTATSGQPGGAPGDADKQPPGAAPANAGDTERGGLKQPDTIAALKTQGLDDLLKTNLIEVPTSVDSWLVNWSAAGPVPDYCQARLSTTSQSTGGTTPKSEASTGGTGNTTTQQKAGGTTVQNKDGALQQTDDPCAAKGNFLLSKLLGVLISIALISLGAPFWYEMLKNLIRLRSLVASKDEDQRKQRQTSQAPEGRAAAPGDRGSSPAAPGTPPVATLAGERGDLAAMG